MNDNNDEHFQLFAENLKKQLKTYDIDLNRDRQQKKQVQALIKTERAFRKKLLSYNYGYELYAAFISFILETKHNILFARSFFRERKIVFEREITPAIKHRRVKDLASFDINYNFIVFILNYPDNRKKKSLHKIFNKIKDLRQELIEMNMPLAISRARLFWNKTPHSHLTYMDLVQISAEGLIAAVDKFVLPYSPVFRSVIIGRATGNFIERYSGTLIHFWPQDKRKIYKANKILTHKESEEDDGELAAKINRESDSVCKTDSGEIRNLMNAVSPVSLTPLVVDSDDEQESTYESDPGLRPDVIFEKMDLSVKLENAMQKLTILEKKVLRLKGISLNGLYRGNI